MGKKQPAWVRYISEFDGVKSVADMDKVLKDFTAKREAQAKAARKRVASLDYGDADEETRRNMRIQSGLGVALTAESAIKNIRKAYNYLLTEVQKAEADWEKQKAGLEAQKKAADDRLAAAQDARSLAQQQAAQAEKDLAEAERKATDSRSFAQGEEHAGQMLTEQAATGVAQNPSAKKRNSSQTMLTKGYQRASLLGV